MRARKSKLRDEKDFVVRSAESLRWSRRLHSMVNGGGPSFAVETMLRFLSVQHIHTGPQRSVPTPWWSRLEKTELFARLAVLTGRNGRNLPAPTRALWRHR